METEKEGETMEKLAKKMLLVLAVLVILLGIVWGAKAAYDSRYVFFAGKQYDRDVPSIELSQAELHRPEALLRFTGLKKLTLLNCDMDQEDYIWIATNLPQCNVVWGAEFQGEYLRPDEESLTVESLTDEDIRDLERFCCLRVLDCRECTDYAQIQAVQEAFPQLTVLRNVELGGRKWGPGTTDLKIRDGDVQEILDRMDYLPRLETIHLTGDLPTMEEIGRLHRRLPDGEVTWTVDIGGVPVDWNCMQLDTEEMELEDCRELEDAFGYLPMLRKVEMLGLDVPWEDKQALAEDYPDIEFVYDIQVGDRWFPTDTREMDLSGHVFSSVREVEDLLPGFPDLEKVIMSDCGIGNEEMDALNRRHEDVKFVWTVKVGGRNTRTDEIYFAANKWGLHMTNNNIYDLRYCTDMICVDIGHHKDVTNCEWAAFMPNLTYLVLADGSVSDLTPLSGLKNLKFLELFLTPVRDYSPLTGCTGLEDLNLCYTYGTDPAPIGEMTWLKRLWWSGNWFAQVGLRDKLPDTQINFTAGSSTGEGWREGRNYYDMRDCIGMYYMHG